MWFANVLSHTNYYYSVTAKAGHTWNIYFRFPVEFLGCTSQKIQRASSSVAPHASSEDSEPHISFYLAAVRLLQWCYYQDQRVERWHVCFCSCELDFVFSWNQGMWVIMFEFLFLFSLIIKLFLFTYDLLIFQVTVYNLVDEKSKKLS